MALFITSLASGSNGNCYYVGNDTEAVLIDAGISCRELEKRAARLSLSLHKIKAIFVSHEHSDHIYGIPVLAKKYSWPVYLTNGTLKNSSLRLQNHPFFLCRENEPVVVGGLSITSFSKAHDAAEPHSFVVSGDNVKVGVFTDIGTPCKKLIRHFSECHAAFLEANYDETMLSQGKYPLHLKNRIRGGNGHLSNRQALEVFKIYKPAYMSHLVLAHISKNNNCPVLVSDLFTPHAGGTHIVVASRYEETALYKIQTETSASHPLAHYRVAASQLSFSFA